MGNYWQPVLIPMDYWGYGSQRLCRRRNETGDHFVGRLGKGPVQKQGRLTRLVWRLLAMLGVGAAVTGPGDGMAANPYLGADQYVNPDYGRMVNQSIRLTQDPHLLAQMRKIKQLPTAVWLDRIPTLAGGGENNQRASLEQHFLAALQQQRKGVPLLVELVIYNLPNRDCAAASSNGTLDFLSNGLSQYQHDYIDQIAALTEDPRFKSLRFVMLLEPDSLPNMVTSTQHPQCAFVKKKGVYRQGIQYAIQRLSQHPNNYLYLDIGHSGWLGWEDSLKAAVSLYRETVAGIGSRAGLGVIDGFVTNISGYTPVEEPFLDRPGLSIGGQPVKSDPFYGWNTHFAEKEYVESLYAALVAAGFPARIHFLVDTSRNGWGGSKRPRARSGAKQLAAYVAESRLDRRFHRGNWCNPAGAGLGERPTVAPFGRQHPVAAFIWAKPPGESDGSSDSSQRDADGEGKRFDPMCGADTLLSQDSDRPDRFATGALADAPAAGHWFHRQFVMLLKNAYPPF